MAGVELLPIVFSLALSEISSQAVNEASQASLAHRFGCHLAHARGSEMNPAKNARIRDFGDRARETRKRACAGTYIRGDRKCRIVSKRGGEDERGGATHRGMGRWILWMCGSAALEKIQPWLPGRIGVGGSETRPDRCDRPPENVAVLAIPTCDCRVG